MLCYISTGTVVEQNPCVAHVWILFRSLIRQTLCPVSCCSEPRQLDPGVSHRREERVTKCGTRHSVLNWRTTRPVLSRTTQMRTPARVQYWRFTRRDGVSDYRGMRSEPERFLPAHSTY